MFVPLFHLSVASLNFFTLWYDQNYLELPLPKEFEVYRDMPFKLRFMFLTIWCLVLHTIYFGIAFLNDLVGSNEVSPKKTPIIRTSKDLLYSFAFPLAFYVATAFWTIYYFYKELILPDEVEKIFPFWMNHVMHTLIVPFIVIELFITPKKYPSKCIGMSFSLFVVFCYLLLLGAAFVKSGTMVYPYLDELSWSVKIGFFAGSIIGGLCFYVIGETLNNLIHNRSPQSGQTQKSKKVKRKAQ